MFGNVDGGTLPSGDPKPWPEYRAPRRTADPKFQQVLAECSDPSIDQRIARNLLLRYFGPTDKTLTELVADLLDEHREYRIRLGEIPGRYYFNAG